MQFDEFDNKVKEAADHHHPAYDEQAWTKMEKLLNKHLPQKEDNRRRFLFLLLLFIGLGGAGLFIVQPWKKGKSETAAEQTIQQNPTVSTQPLSAPGKGENTTANIIENDRPGKVVTINNTSEVSDPRVAKLPVNLSGNNESKKSTTSTQPVIASLNTKTKKDKPSSSDDKSWWQNNDTKSAPDNNTTTDPVIAKTTIPVNDAVSPGKKDEQFIPNTQTVNTTKPSINETVITESVKKESEPIAANKKTKTKNKKSNSFFFSLSAGPDISFVGSDKPGSTRLLAGIGLGYTFKDRLTIRTGFYSGRKVYTASPGAYHAPPSFYTFYPYLEKVDANCKVYEIPVSLSYNFGKSASKNWFVSAGLSSFLMKEESYNYHYKYTPSGNTYTNKWTIKNENQHFFSVATISAGYKKQVGKRVTFIAEPYFKVPIAGVGYGKVKLNSGGVLFTVGIKPF